MRADVERFIAREALLVPRQPVWVAVSGGVDSMVLLHVLRSLGHPCNVVHVDHGLRGEASAGDRAFVEAYCSAQNIPCRSYRVDVAAHAEAHGGSVQMAGRALRYALFQELVREGPHVLALGHHADDAVETLLLHVLRGTGALGWASIPPKSGPFVRPLLGVDRAAIADYARARAVPFREDASNTDPKYLRNRVRAELLPFMEALRPGARLTLSRSLGMLRELTALAEVHVRQQLPDQQPDAHGIRRLPFTSLAATSTPLLLLQAWTATAGFHPDVLEAMLGAVDAHHTGAHFVEGTHRVTVDRDALLLDELPTLAEFVVHAGTDGEGGGFIWHFGADVPASIAGADTAWLDADRLHFPLLLRPWREGDRMRPMGLAGSKLISDLLIDAKVPLPMKDRTYVLLSGDAVVWASGLRVGEGVRAVPGTRHVLRIGLRH